jgi:hypothetical protein
LTTKATTISKLILILGLALLLAVEGFFAWRLHLLSGEQEQVKQDYTDINNITLGLMSVDNWKDKVADIVSHQVKHFKLTPKQKKELQVEVEQIINALIDKAEAMVNKPQKSLGGKIKKLVVKTFVKTDKIRAQVPEFARAIIAKVDNTTQKTQLSTLAMSKFKEAQHSGSLDSAHKANETLTQKMFRKYQVSSSEDLDRKLTALLQTYRTETFQYCFGMLACILVVLACWWFLRKRVELHATLFILSLLFAFILLAVGLTASMIEVDARIRSLDFVLLGERIHFQNQVLFYESKSIMGVVEVLFRQPAPDSIGVGLLILCFSILFPLTKLASTGIHLLSSRKLAENRLIKFFAFQSGKWSMADVIVIAILMTYIGLNGLLDSQLVGLNIKTNDLALLTTNNTTLQPGYIIFISFVLYGLILSTILKAITPYDAH